MGGREFFPQVAEEVMFQHQLMIVIQKEQHSMKSKGKISLIFPSLLVVRNFTIYNKKVKD